MMILNVIGNNQSSYISVGGEENFPVAVIHPNAIKTTHVFYGLNIGATSELIITATDLDDVAIVDLSGNLVVTDSSGTVVANITYINNNDGTYKAVIPDSITATLTRFSRYMFLTELETVDGDKITLKCEYIAQYVC